MIGFISSNLTKIGFAAMGMGMMFLVFKLLGAYGQIKDLNEVILEKEAKIVTLEQTINTQRIVIADNTHKLATFNDAANTQAITINQLQGKITSLQQQNRINLRAIEQWEQRVEEREAMLRNMRLTEVQPLVEKEVVIDNATSKIFIGHISKSFVN